MLKNSVTMMLHIIALTVALLSLQISTFVYIASTFIHAGSIKEGSMLKYILFSIIYLPVASIIFPVFVWSSSISIIQIGDYNVKDEECLFHKKLLYKITFYNTYLFSEDYKIIYQQ